MAARRRRRAVSNPIPAKWITAKVRRLGDKFQIMLTGKSARRPNPVPHELVKAYDRPNTWVNAGTRRSAASKSLAREAKSRGYRTKLISAGSGRHTLFVLWSLGRK